MNVEPIVVEQSEEELLRLFGDAKLAKAAKQGRMTPELLGALQEAKEVMDADLTPEEELIAAAKAKKRLTEAAAEGLGLDDSFFTFTTKLTPHQVKKKAKTRRRDAITKKIRQRTQRKRKKK